MKTRHRYRGTAGEALSRGLLGASFVALLVTLALAACQGTATPQKPPIATEAWGATGEGPRSRFGYAVAGAGDVNGDGYADVIVGADQFKQFTGRAYVYAGGPDGLGASPLFVASGEDVNNHFGYAVGGGGDVNGDGYADVIVGAYHFANFRGRVTLYRGGPRGVADAPFAILTGTAPGTYFGRAVGVAGDVNGDGYADVIVGAPYHDRSAGQAALFPGGPDGLGDAPLWVAVGEAPSSAFGGAVGTAGDVNGDGYADVIVGAPGHDRGAGQITVYAGGPGGPTGPIAAPLLVATGKAAGDRLGHAVGTAGDVNGDGYADVVVGAYGAAEGAGSVHLYAGGPAGPSADPVFTAAGPGPGAWFGRAVGAAGDWNGDGYADVVVGAPSARGDAGRVYVYLGSAAGMEARPIEIESGQDGAIWFGHAVGGAGDVNGDGFGDLIIGAYGHATWTGQAMLYPGGPTSGP